MKIFKKKKSRGKISSKLFHTAFQNYSLKMMEPSRAGPLLWSLEVEMAKIFHKNPRVDHNVQNDAMKLPETIAR